mgnify:CR=1 FL=1
MDKLYTAQQVADRYSVPLPTVWRWIREKKLVAIRPGKEYRIREADLLAFEESSATRKTTA